MEPIEFTSGRTEGIALGLAPIRFKLGGLPKALPPLPIDGTDVWVTGVGAALAGAIDGLEEITSWDQVAAAVGTLPTAVIVELLVAYDETGALGGREWIRAHATPTEVYEALRAVALVALPILREAKSFPVLSSLVIEFLRARLTSSSSLSGDSTPRPSGAAGPPSSSSSTRSGSENGAGPRSGPSSIGSSRRSRRGSGSR